MWEIGLAHQLIGSAYSLAVGVFFSLVYDVLKAFCLKYNCGVIAVFVKDIAFSLFAAFVTFMLLMARSNGAVRGYILFFIVAGFVLFRVTLSKFWLKFWMLFFSGFIKLKTVLSAFLQRFCDRLDSFELKVLKIFKKMLKKALKLIKNS